MPGSKNSTGPADGEQSKRQCRAPDPRRPSAIGADPGTRAFISMRNSLAAQKTGRPNKSPSRVEAEFSPLLLATVHSLSAGRRLAFRSRSPIRLPLRYNGLFALPGRANISRRPLKYRFDSPSWRRFSSVLARQRLSTSYQAKTIEFHRSSTGRSLLPIDGVVRYKVP